MTRPPGSHTGSVIGLSSAGGHVWRNGFALGGAIIRLHGGLSGLTKPAKIGGEAIDLAIEKRPAQVAVKLKAIREKTTFRQRQVTRIVNGINASKATGTIEFLLSEDVVKFHLTGESSARELAAHQVTEKVNPWDKVLKNGKAEPALTVIKKVP
jgi:hypothetical protein